MYQDQVLSKQRPHESGGNHIETPTRQTTPDTDGAWGEGSHSILCHLHEFLQRRLEQAALRG